MSEEKLSFGRVLYRTALVLLLTVFALMGLCSGLFSAVDLASPHPGHQMYVGLLPYFLLVISMLGLWGCAALVKRFWRAK